MATYEDLLDDEQRDEHFVVVASPRDPATGAAVDGHYVDRGRQGQLAPATEPTDSPANQPMDAVVLSAAGYESDVIDPLALAQVPAVRGGSLVLGQRLGHLDGLREQLWDGAPVTVRHGGIGRTGRVAWADYGRVVQAEASSALVGLDRVEVALRDPRERLESPALVRRFREFGDYALQWGASSIAALGTPAKLDLPGDIVIEGWWRPSAIAAVVLIGWGGGTRRPWGVVTTAGGALQMSATDAAGATITAQGTATMVAERLYHWAILRIGTAMRFVLLDEASGVETVDSATMGAAAAAAGGAVCRLSASAAPALGYAYGEWRVWVPPASVDNTLETIRSRRGLQLDAAEIAGQPYAYVCRYSEGTGTTLADSGAGTAAPGAITGTVTWRASLVPSALVGQRMRRAVGRVKRLEPIPVDPANLVYFIAGHRIFSASVSSVLTAGGSAIAFNTTRGTLAGFQGAVPPAGTYEEFIAGPDATYIKLGSVPTRPLQLTFQGDRTGGAYVENAGAAAQRVLETCGQNPYATAEIDTAALAALPAYPVGLVIDGETTVREALGRILGSVGALAWPRREDGLITAAVFSGTAAGTVLGDIDERDIVSIDPIPAGAPVWQVTATHDRRWSTLTTDQMSSPPLGSATETDFTRPHLEISNRRLKTRTDHPRSRDIRIDTVLALKADAKAEAARVRQLFDADGGAPRAYRVVCRFRPFMADLDFLRLIDVSYRDLDLNGNKRVRLGLDLTRFAILAFRVDHTSPTKEGGSASRRVTLTLWRED